MKGIFYELYKFAQKKVQFANFFFTKNTPNPSKNPQNERSKIEANSFFGNFLLRKTFIATILTIKKKFTIFVYL